MVIRYCSLCSGWSLLVGVDGVGGVGSGCSDLGWGGDWDKLSHAYI